MHVLNCLAPLFSINIEKHQSFVWANLGLYPTFLQITEPEAPVCCWLQTQLLPQADQTELTLAGVHMQAAQSAMQMSCCAKSLFQNS